MSLIAKKTRPLWYDPKVWVLIVALGLFVLVARSFFMGDAAKKMPVARTAVFIFFRQEVKPKDMPSLLKSFGAEGCTTIGGGTHVYQCTQSNNPQEVLQKAQSSEVVFDSLIQDAVTQ